MTSEPATERYRVWVNGLCVGETSDSGQIRLSSEPVDQREIDRRTLRPVVTYVKAKKLPVGWWVYEEGAWWRTGGWCPTWKIARHRMNKLG